MQLEPAAEQLPRHPRRPPAPAWPPLPSVPPVAAAPALPAAPPTGEPAAPRRLNRRPQHHPAPAPPELAPPVLQPPPLLVTVPAVPALASPGSVASPTGSSPQATTEHERRPQRVSGLTSSSLRTVYQGRELPAAEAVHADVYGALSRFRSHSRSAATSAAAHDHVRGTRRREGLRAQPRDPREPAPRLRRAPCARLVSRTRAPATTRPCSGSRTPDGAAAVGLKTLGSVRRPTAVVRGGAPGGPRRQAARYKELTGIGGYYPKDPALLSWRSQRELLLQVFPVAPDDSKTIEYTCSSRPATRTERTVTPCRASEPPSSVQSWTLARARHGDQLLVAGKSAQAGARLTPTLDESVELVWSRRRRSPSAASSPVASRARASSRTSRSKPRHASRVGAARAQIVVVIDASRSVGGALLDAQRPPPQRI